MLPMHLDRRACISLANDGADVLAAALCAVLCCAAPRHALRMPGPAAYSVNVHAVLVLAYYGKG